ncbi:pyridoxamine 5'-phosphate oxidase [Burkholderia pseudomallei]|nr:pyridoxamine 5'-phosphate oxidase [Burkholderia pseudomallei]RFS48685.1 pyridoxamine 5'-phosphate oxidase [Burkholderia pseudomallei]
MHVSDSRPGGGTSMDASPRRLSVDTLERLLSIDTHDLYRCTSRRS